MDAQAHLLSLGWAGPGHALDSYKQKGKRGLAYNPSAGSSIPTFANGLVKPILASQKKNNFGIGKKAHEPAKGNEWWLKGFETALSNMKKGETSETATPEIPGESGRGSGAGSGYMGKHEGLYGFFVKGTQMEGTMLQDDTEDVPNPLNVARSKTGKKRKSDTFDGSGDSRSETARPSESIEFRKKSKSKDGTKDFEQVSDFLALRDKEEKRRQRGAKPGALEEFQQMGQFLEIRSKKTNKTERHADFSTARMEIDLDKPELEEARQRLRKAEKVARNAQTSRGSSDKENTWTTLTSKTATEPSGGEGGIDETLAARAARRAERKGRKAVERQGKQSRP